MSKQGDRVKALEVRRASQRAEAAGWTAARWLAALQLPEAERIDANKRMMEAAGMSAAEVNRWQGIAEKQRAQAAEALEFCTIAFCKGGVE